MNDDDTHIRERVRARYAAAATALDGHYAKQSGPPGGIDRDGQRVFGGSLYDPGIVGGVPSEALAASLGCGVPTLVADLQPGEIVLDLGSGAGADVLISARRVAPNGRVIGLDMTLGMVELARRNAERAGIDNVEFLEGYIEDIPLPDASVDIVMSNCVINLAADKAQVLREVARVLRRGGRLAVSDVIADAGLDQPAMSDLAQSTGCIAGALTEDQSREILTDVGMIDLDIKPTHRVHRHANAATIRAHKP